MSEVPLEGGGWSNMRGSPVSRGWESVLVHVTKIGADMTCKSIPLGKWTF